MGDTKKKTMSKTRIMCHIVFGTKARENSINPEHKQELYNYIAGIIKKKGCYVDCINGIEDHVHMLIDLNPTQALADMMEVVKSGSSNWLKRNPDFIRFKGWGSGYYAVSVSPDRVKSCRDYIKNQEKHHHDTGFMWEIENLIKGIGLGWYPDDWT